MINNLARPTACPSGQKHLPPPWNRGCFFFSTSVSVRPSTALSFSFSRKFGRPCGFTKNRPQTRPMPACVVARVGNSLARGKRCHGGAGGRREDRRTGEASPSRSSRTNIFRVCTPIHMCVCRHVYSSIFFNINQTTVEFFFLSFVVELVHRKNVMISR